MSSNASNKSDWPLIFRIIGVLGAASLGVSIAWLYVWQRHFPFPIRTYPEQIIEYHWPTGGQVMLWIGFLGLIVSATGSSGSKLLRRTSMLGSVGIAIALAWLTLWNYLVVERARAAYSSDAPAVAIWMLLVSGVIIGVSGISAIAVVGVRRLTNKSGRPRPPI